MQLRQIALHRPFLKLNLLHMKMTRMEQIKILYPTLVFDAVLAVQTCVCTLSCQLEYWPNCWLGWYLNIKHSSIQLRALLTELWACIRNPFSTIMAFKLGLICILHKVSFIADFTTYTNFIGFIFVTCVSSHITEHFTVLAIILAFPKAESDLIKRISKCSKLSACISSHTQCPLWP